LDKMAKLQTARYGKDNIRVSKIERGEDGVHNVTEMTVRVMLEGEIDVSYTHGDNTPVVATDSIKNTVNILAKQNPVSPPELFASIVGTHFISFYAHIHKALVSIVVHRWTRMVIDGKPHPHSFLRDSAETRNIEVVVTEGASIEIYSVIKGLTVLKSTESQFYGFIRDEYTTLKETWDRVLSTQIDAGLTWKSFKSVDEVRALGDTFNTAFDQARDKIIRTFAMDLSKSGQDSIYKMGDLILKAVKEVEAVDFSLPNLHFFEIDMSWHKGIQNTGEHAEVLAPQTNPNGLLKCTVTRD